MTDLFFYDSFFIIFIDLYKQFKKNSSLDEIWNCMIKISN
jgi:hypothetical protein